jgi:hypothetical protein
MTDLKSLYGLNSKNCVAKDDSSQKIANTLLPICACIYAKHKEIPILLFSSNGEKNNFNYPFDAPTPFFNTEVANLSPGFVNPPPNDVYVSYGDGKKEFYESKIAKFTETDAKRFELILRQDCYAFNCVQSILLNNPGKTFGNTEELIGTQGLQETPYLILLLCNSSEGRLAFEPIAFTDISLLHMIYKAETARSKEAIKLINHSLNEYKTSGKITYKESKSSTVAHQKVSLFPFKALKNLSSHPFTFPIQSTDLILNQVRPDWNLWQEVEKARSVKSLKEEVDRLRALLALHGLSSE